MGAAAVATSALGGAGALTGIAGGIVQAQGEAEATAWKVQQDQVNQQLQLGLAASVMRRGAWESQQAQLKGGQIEGQQRAGYGASGVDANSGSAAAVQAASKAMSGVDAQQAMVNASQQAWGYQVTGNQYGAQAGVDKQLGQDQEEATALGTAGSALSSAGSITKNAVELGS